MIVRYVVGYIICEANPPLLEAVTLFTEQRQTRIHNYRIEVNAALPGDFRQRGL